MSDTSGPAFPTRMTTEFKNMMVPDAPPVYAEGFVTGMTLRDYFAAQALNGLVEAIRTVGTVWMPSGIATTCYELADAMLKAREQ